MSDAMKARPDKVTRQFLAVTSYLVTAGDKEVYGYAISEATGLHRPTVYKMLERMAEMGWLTQRWDTPTAGATRRLYRLTDPARKAAAALMREHQVKAATPPPMRVRRTLSSSEVEQRVAGLREALNAVDVATEQFGARWETARKWLTVMLEELDPAVPG